MLTVGEFAAGQYVGRSLVAGLVLRQQVGEEVDRLHQVPPGGEHHEVDRVEVLLAPKATTEIT
jgi:hypothetical protein